MRIAVVSDTQGSLRLCNHPREVFKEYVRYNNRLLLKFKAAPGS
jgi:hypothetical protein